MSDEATDAAPAPAHPVERLFPFVLKTQALLIGRDTLRANKGNLSGELKFARKLGRRRGRKTSEEAAGQARAIVDHEGGDDPAGAAGLIWNHPGFLTRGFPRRQSIDRQARPHGQGAATKKARG